MEPRWGLSQRIAVSHFKPLADPMLTTALAGRSAHAIRDDVR